MTGLGPAGRANRRAGRNGFEQQMAAVSRITTLTLLYYPYSFDEMKDIPKTGDLSLEFRPLSILRFHIDRFWFCGRSAVSVSEILPDGCVDVVFRLSTSSIETLLFGPVTRNISFPLRADSEYFGVRFRAGQAARFLSDRPAEMVNRYGSIGILPCLNGEQFINLPTFQDRCSLLEATLFSLLAREDVRTDVIEWAVRTIECRKGMVEVCRLAAACDLSLRQFERRFSERVGITPKTFCRVVRFQHALSALRGGLSGNLASLAAELGFADQSHFIRDFKSLCDYLPSHFISS